MPKVTKEKPKHGRLYRCPVCSNEYEPGESPIQTKNVLENSPLYDAAPQMRKALADLLEWESYTGGWSDPAWEEARKLLNNLREKGL